MSKRTMFVGMLLMLLSSSFVPLVLSKSYAASPGETSRIRLREIGLISGYGSAQLSEKASEYEVIPLLLQFGFDIKPLAKKLHLEPKGTFEGIIEPLMNMVTHPDANAEVGCSFLLKYSDKITARIAPYFEGGLGVIYTTQHTHEQGTQFNFLTQVGIGLQVCLTPTWALTGGYRFRHLSNAGIDDDNEGIDHHFGLVGVSYIFK